jgi:hypothetical protein
VQNDKTPPSEVTSLPTSNACTDISLKQAVVGTNALIVTGTLLTLGCWAGALRVNTHKSANIMTDAAVKFVLFTIKSSFPLIRHEKLPGQAMPLPGLFRLDLFPDSLMCITANY